MQPNRNPKHKSKKKGNHKQLVKTGSILPRAACQAVMFKTLMPDEVLVTFKYNPSFALNNAGLNNASRTFTANGLYDIDPSLGSTATPGFAEWMTLYFNYRVVRIRASVELANRDNINNVASLAFHNTGFSANAYLETYFENPTSRVKMVGWPNAGVTTMALPWTDVSTIQGSVEPLTGANWAGTSSANPVDNVYCTVAISCVGAGGGPLVNGVNIRLQLYFETLLYHRRSLTS